MPSLIVPAHNEARTVRRLLSRLLDGDGPQDLEIIVVCNGCTDGTAAAAKAYGSAVTVIEVAEANKAAALAVGDRAATSYPRLYIDADVELGGADVHALVDALAGSQWLAVGPRRVIPTEQSSWPVRWYYDVWQGLPQVAEGLFGRGVIAVGARGHGRLTALPRVTADDLVASEAFAPEERRVIETATVVIHPPRTVSDLLKRRVRITQGNREADSSGLRSAAARTTPRDLWAMARREPLLLFKIPVFMVIAAAGRGWYRWQTSTGRRPGWTRDDSSRS